jgi:hypothetical protein
VAKAIRTKSKGRKALTDDKLPFTKQNFVIMGVGLLTITVGYLAMLGAPVEGFLPLVASPILLLIGYCVIVPFGILYRPSMFSRQAMQSGETAQQKPA